VRQGTWQVKPHWHGAGGRIGIADFKPVERSNWVGSKRIRAKAPSQSHTLRGHS
jgi:hypothetical protein